MIDSYYIFYLIFVLIIGISLFVGFRYWMSLISKRRQKRIRKLEDFEVIKVESEDITTLKQSRDNAIKVVKKRYSVINRIILWLIVSIVFLASIFPFLDVFPSTFISLIVAATGILIGIAAKPIIENAFSGLVMSVSKTIRIGDTVMINEHYGTVEDINLTHSIIKKWNWQRYIIPNSKMLTNEIISHSYNDNHLWAHVEFHISYEADLDRVKQLAIESAAQSQYNTQDEEVSFWVIDMKETSVQCRVAAWTDSPGNGWELRNEIRTALFMSFQREGIKSHQWNINPQDP